MRKRFVLLFLFLMFSILFSESYLLALTEGKVVETENKRLFVAKGESITVDIGEKDGVTKGDVLRILKRDERYRGPVGECIVTRTTEGLSTCQIIKTGREVETGDIVLAERLEYFDGTLGRTLISVIKEMIEPYRPEAKISVYFAGHFDTQNRLTAFSQIVAREFLNITLSKKQFRTLEKEEIGRLKGLINYPDYYFKTGEDSYYIREVDELKKIMAKMKLDLILMGTYEVKNGNVVVSFYSVDRTFGVKKVVRTLPKEQYSRYLEEVIEPMKEIKPKASREIAVSYKSEHFFPSSYEQRNIAIKEAQEDVEFRYAVLERKVKFNRISPANVLVKINEVPLKLSEGEIQNISLEEGTHKISCAFQPAFYNGSDLVYVSKRKFTKEIFLEITGEVGKPKINVDIIISPLAGHEDIGFDLYRKVDLVDKTIKEVGVRKETKGKVEVYKD
jgi:hypothetical protein